MENTISKSKFKPRALEYFRLVQETGRELTITEHGRPVLKIVPYSEQPEQALKALRNTVRKYLKPTEPVGVRGLGIAEVIVLDTHAWVWWASDPARLSVPARRAIEGAVMDGGLLVSSISAWEVAMLRRRGTSRADTGCGRLGRKIRGIAVLGVRAPNQRDRYSVRAGYQASFTRTPRTESSWRPP